MYSAKSRSTTRNTALGELIDDISPLRTLGTGGKRPTVLELGPAVTAAGSDLVRSLRPVTAAAVSSAWSGGGSSAAVEGPTPTPMPREISREEKAERIARKTELQKVRAEVQQAATITSKVDGHAEAALTVLRDFFSTRPYQVLLEVFRDQDGDSSNGIDFDEFSVGLRKLNLDLSDKDMRAVFTAADADNSGAVDLDEFVNCFRADSFPRDTFFWSKTRPRGLLNRFDRVRLAQTLGAGAISKIHTTDEIMGVVQEKVDQFSAKTVFNSLDDNRSGRVNVRELVDAMREMEIRIPDAKCEEIFRTINAKVGDSNTTHLTYRSFTNAFDKGTHEGTTGSDEGVVAKAQGLWRKDATAPAARQGRAGGGRSSVEELDSIQRLFSTHPGKNKISTIPHDRGKVYEEEIDEKLMLMKRYDMLSSWRGVDGTGAFDNPGEGIGAMGRGHDWYEFKAEQAHRILSKGVASSTGGTMHGAPSSGAQQMAVVRANAAARKAARKAAADLAAEAASAAESSLSNSVAGCLLPQFGSPSYAEESVRLSPRPFNWSPDRREMMASKVAKQRAAARRRKERDSVLLARHESEDAEEERLETARYLVQKEFGQRIADWQQVIESRVAESGRMHVLLEPPSSDATDPKTGQQVWSHAPPHITSHWDTITGHNKDPPARTHVKTISCYRKYFPSVDDRPPTPRHPVWGGDRENAIRSGGLL